MSGIPRLELINTQRSQGAPLPRLRPRGVPPALEGHELFRSAHPADAALFLTDLLGGNAKLSTERSPLDFQVTVNAIALRGLSLAHIEFQGPVDFEVPGVGDQVSVIVHTYGESEVAVATTRLPANATSAIVTSPGDHLRVSLSEPGSMLIVRIEREQVDRALARMLGRRITETIRFEPALDLTAARSVRWTIAMQLLQAEIMSDDSLLRRGSGQAELEELLISSLVLLQPSNYSQHIVAHGGRKGTIRLATEYIEQNLAEPIVLGDIAAAVHLGPRTIQQAFRDALGVTPMEYLRDQRLERVRADLLGASLGDGVSVTSAAERWGFTHLGSFAVQYRERYGETPSRTLRGGR